MTTPRYVVLSAAQSTVGVEIKTYQGKPYRVFPVVALVGDVVVEGLLSTGPEFVPSSVLAAAPSGFDGRPVVNVHPAGGSGSANTPNRWESECFGQVFGSRFENGRLIVDVYLDPDKAALVGEDATEVITKADAGEMVEVSVGAWVWLVDEEGTSPSGQPYTQKWVACTYDHLAVGLQSQGSGKGACSVEMGCGGPRLLSVNSGLRTLTAEQASLTLNGTYALKEQKMDPISRIAKALATELETSAAYQALAEGMSDSALRQRINRALRAVVPGFWGVEEVFPDSSTAIYMAMPEDDLQWWECAFTVDGDNVTIGRRKQVQPVTKWEKVAAAASDSTADDTEEKPATLAANCGCDKADHTTCTCSGNEPPTPTTHLAATAITPPASPTPGALSPPPTPAAQPVNVSKGDSMDPKIEALVGRLIACSTKAAAAGGTPTFTDTDKDKLGALSEEQLTAMVTLAERPEPAPADPNLVTLSKTEADRLRRMAAREEDREKAHRKSLTAALVASGNCKYTEQQLGAKATDDLELLAESMGLLDESTAVVDFSGRVHAASAATETNINDYAPPDPWKVGNLAKQLGYKPAADTAKTVQ